ncbi:MAG: hypothetical protein U9R25_17680 [Chloroflexota bacterium]|nr:hypothetical protein [Chloroflexota bacterium]
MKPKRLRPNVMVSIGLLLSLALLLAACGGSAEPTPAAEHVATATDAPTAALATDTPAIVPPTDTPVPADSPETEADEGPADTPVPPIESPTAVPATDTPVPAEEPAVTSIFGQTGEGQYFRGNPDAAVTVIDYSDFL